MEIEALRQQAAAAKAAAQKLAQVPNGMRNAALEAMAAAILTHKDEILAANALDLEAGRNKGLSSALLDRLALNPKRLEEMATGLRALIALPDPLGCLEAGWTCPNGLEIQKVRVPLGVVGIIYEARPNVTVDAAGLCLKSGNAVILRGGSEALNSNMKLGAILAEAATAAGIPAGAIAVVANPDRKVAQALMCLPELDVLIPRGGAGLIRSVVENATVPVIETGVGNCHTYVDESADLAMAEAIVINAKVQRPAVCNAMETLLIHTAIAPQFVPQIVSALKGHGVEVRGCPQTCALAPGVTAATELDWETEFLDLILAIKVVDDLPAAIAHINRYGSGHSEAIITQDYHNARHFLQAVDAAAVYVNASTRFTDGFQFGLGAEIGISTQKLHARGPMGLQALTTTKYILYGDGQIRN